MDALSNRISLAKSFCIVILVLLPGPIVGLIDQKSRVCSTYVCTYLHGCLHQSQQLHINFGTWLRLIRLLYSGTLVVLRDKLLCRYSTVYTSMYVCMYLMEFLRCPLNPNQPNNWRGGGLSHVPMHQCNSYFNCSIYSIGEFYSFIYTSSSTI